MPAGIFIALFGYLLVFGPFGLIFTKFFSKVDPRETGSKNIGATNISEQLKEIRCCDTDCGRSEECPIWMRSVDLPIPGLAIAVWVPFRPYLPSLLGFKVEG